MTVQRTAAPHSTLSVNENAGAYEETIVDQGLLEEKLQQRLGKLKNEEIQAVADSSEPPAQSSPLPAVVAKGTVSVAVVSASAVIGVLLSSILNWTFDGSVFVDLGHALSQVRSSGRLCGRQAWPIRDVGRWWLNRALHRSSGPSFPRS